MHNNRLKDDNNGLSIVEIIIVIAIISILATTLVLATGAATNKHVNSCALKIASALEQTRSLALGKQGAYVDIWQDPNDDVYLQMYVNGQPYGGLAAVGRPGLSVSITRAGGTPTALGTSTSPTRISFSRSNGSVTEVPAVTNISVTNGRRVYEVTIDSYTGRVTSEMTTP